MATYEHIKYMEKQSIHILHFFARQKDKVAVVKQHYHRSLEIILPIIGGVHILCNGRHVHINSGKIYNIHTMIVYEKGGKL